MTDGRRAGGQGGGSDAPAPDYAIRVATTDDAAALARIGARLFTDTFAADNRPEDIAQYVASAFGEAVQRREIEQPGSRFWLAEREDGTPVGFVRLKFGATSDAVDARRPVELCRLYADRSYHGRGLGGALVRTCIDDARAWGGDVLWLGVWERNHRAIAFYTKHGFRAVGEQSFQLGSDLQRDLVMALPIDR